MAEYLSIFRMPVCCALLLSAASVAGAQTLPDPTRPPASLGVISADDSSGSVSGPILQSVLISPGRRVAIISGQTVSVGDKVGDAAVVKIADDEVVLRSGKALQTLKLFPDIEKRAAVETAPPKSIVGGNKGKQ